MEENLCKNCAYYRQHYILNEEKIFRIYCGHCVKGRVKRKKPYAIACPEFVMAESDEDRFVSKEYLGKELLRYMLSLDLLPKIEEKKE